MPEQNQKKSDWTGAWFAVGAIFYLAAVYALVFWKSGRLMGESGFKGILWGTFGGGFAIIILSAAVATAVEKLAQPLRARLELAALCALAAFSVIFGWRVAFATLREDPSTYYYGTATGQYSVTYTSGKVETKSGAELGGNKWDWAVALYLSITLTTGAAALYGFVKRLRTG